ncbi:MAG: hypothetical protein ACRDAM_15940 [Casimicrobium sp.]
MWHALITIIFIANNGSAHPSAVKMIAFPDQPACVAFVRQFEHNIKAANPREIVLAKCEKIPPKANA